MREVVRSISLGLLVCPVAKWPLVHLSFALIVTRLYRAKGHCHADRHRCRTILVLAMCPTCARHRLILQSLCATRAAAQLIMPVQQRAQLYLDAFAALVHPSVVATLIVDIHTYTLALILAMAQTQVWTSHHQLLMMELLKLITRAAHSAPSLMSATNY